MTCFQPYLRGEETVNVSACSASIIHHLSYNLCHFYGLLAINLLGICQLSLTQPSFAVLSLFSTLYRLLRIMVMRTGHTFLSFFILSLFLLSANLVSSDSREERESHRCIQQCSEQHSHDERRLRQCQRQCEEYQRERKERGERSWSDVEEREYQQKRLQQCRQQCSEGQQSQRQRQICESRCEQRYGEEVQRDESERGEEQRYERCRQECRHQRPEDQRICEQRCEEQYRQEERRGRRGEYFKEGETQRGYPYVFHEQSFQERVRTEEGYIKILERFSKRSDLLRGIENYRLVTLEANPHSFVIPNHWDADAVVFVVKGKGTITLLGENDKRSYNIQKGSILWIPSGTTVYLINRDNREKLQIAKLVQPVSHPTHVEAFFGAGGQNPESFYRSFSTDILEAALNTPREKIERLFGQQRKGIILKASEEQIRELSRHASSSTKGGSSQWPSLFNLFEKRPTFSNNRGQVYEANQNDYEAFKKLNLEVSFINISRGSMEAPFFHTRSTRLVLVVKGRGRFEMTCPHISRQSRGSEEEEHGRRPWEQRERYRQREHEQEQDQGTQYQRISSDLSSGKLIVIPASHPSIWVASSQDNLQLVVFGVNARNNRKIFLSGENNVWKQLDKEAKELAFDLSSREVDEVLNAQSESVFLPGPEQRRERRTDADHGPLESILDFAGF